jgi:acetyltransferase-like isoleucine patch superfamily enzyme
MKGRLPIVTHNQFTYGNLGIFDAGISPDKEGAKITYGAFCSFAQNITLMIGGHHRTELITTYPFGYTHENIFSHEKICLNKGDIVIGNDVWIGNNVTIMAGVTIGDGAVIGCCTVVTKDVEPYSIVAGNPGRFIRYRFSEGIIEELLNIRWWDLPLEIIQAIVPHLMSSDMGQNIQKIKDIIIQHGIHQ